MTYSLSMLSISLCSSKFLTYINLLLSEELIFNILCKVGLPTADSHHFRLPFFFFWYFHHVHITPFVVGPRLMMFLFLQSFFLLLYSFRSFCQYLCVCARVHCTERINSELVRQERRDSLGS